MFYLDHYVIFLLLPGGRILCLFKCVFVIHVQQINISTYLCTHTFIHLTLHTRSFRFLDYLF